MLRPSHDLKATIILEDGSSFHGFSFGFPSNVSGEVVFNTGMVGYPESLTDPSYSGQILVLTYPLIGNYGIPDNERVNGILKNFESEKIQVKALIVSSHSDHQDHWSGIKTLEQWLIEENIPAIHGVATRSLTKILRERGTMLGKIILEGLDNDLGFYDPNKGNLVQNVSTKEVFEYNKERKGRKRILLIDCGVKNNILRCLLKRNVQVIRVPWNHDPSDYEYDGIVISNGPGDPKMCLDTIANVKKVLEDDKPVFGICLGNQIMALAAGMDTYKMKYGHRSQNQPAVHDGRCFITSQNHGYAVKETSIKGWEVWFKNANDGTNEGIKHKKLPFISVQFHPEGNPGPRDTEFLFDEFLKMVK
jgi:carbamoyl-phosphate synthase small subunit